MKAGFIATYTVLLVSAVVISSVLTVMILSVGSGQGSVATGLGKGTLALVEGCVEDSLQKARLNATFGDPVGTLIPLTLPEGNCGVTVNSKVGSTWTMTVRVATPSGILPTPTPVPPTITPTSGPGTPTPTPFAGCGVPNFAWTKTNVMARGGQPTTQQITCLKQNGFNVFVRQNMADETAIPESMEQAAVEAAPAATYNGAFKIPDDTTYAPAMLESMMNYVVGQINQGKRVLVHDTAGRGRMGFWDATFLMWDGYGTGEQVIEDRFLAKTLPFQGAKIGCNDGGNGHVQALAEISQILTGVTYFPVIDEWGTTWQNCPRPSYMNGWNYATITWPTNNNWAMAGANPKRTSWTAESLPGNIATVWVKPISPYVSSHVQVIGAAGKVFVSTSAGLYAFDASTGADAWVYATALPLGHSPTYDAGYLYVGGLDHKLHKVLASSGVAAWTFMADGGFSTSPVVASGKVYAGNRDGAFYAVNANTGALAWKYQTGGQILQSAALADNTLYFASNDGYAYALNATNGALVWKSASKLPGMGFYVWWPVIYQNNVIFTRATFGSGHTGEETDYLLCPPPTPPATRPVGCSTQNTWTPGALGTVPGNWVAGTATQDLNVNTHGITFADYFETFPHYRNIIFYNRTTGQEVNFDIDNDGITDAAPVGWTGDGGTPSPPLVSGFDNVLYFRTYNRGGGGFGSKTVSGWNVGTSIISLPFSNVNGQSGSWPGDEPSGMSSSGSKIYWNHCCDRYVGAADISLPNTNFLSNVDDANRQWRYLTSGGLPFYSWPSNLGVPNFYFKEAVKYFWDPQLGADPPCCAAVFWNENDKVGPAIYQGKMYTILGNALVAMASGGAGSNAPILTSAPTVAPAPSQITLTETELKAKLEQQVSAIVAAGHLKPSFMFSGNITSYRARSFDDYLNHYWHNPADTQLILLRALPFLSPGLQLSVKTYLQSEFASFPPYTYAHVGFVEGNQRDPYVYPPTESTFNSFTIPTLAKQTGSSFNGWAFPPYNVYALWKYAQAGLGNPATLLTAWGTKLKVPITLNATGTAPLTDIYLRGYPLVHNAYIAAYKGYVELAKLAGQTPAQYGPYETELNRLLALRVSQLMTYPNPQEPQMCESECYYESLITYFNFAYLTPELADYLSANAQGQVLDIINTYQTIAPYWMQAHNGETQGESVIQPYQQTYALFQALAQVKHATRSELLKYLDTPIVPVGDLYYIDNLVSTLQAPDTGGATPTPSPIPTVTPTPPPGSTPTPSPTSGPTPTAGPGALGPAFQRTIRVIFNRAPEAITIISWLEI